MTCPIPAISVSSGDANAPLSHSCFLPSQ